MIAAAEPRIADQSLLDVEPTLLDRSPLAYRRPLHDELQFAVVVRRRGNREPSGPMRNEAEREPGTLGKLG